MLADDLATSARIGALLPSGANAAVLEPPTKCCLSTQYGYFSRMPHAARFNAKALVTLRYDAVTSG
jgi:hypothetical protein